MKKILPVILLSMALVVLGTFTLLASRRAAKAEHTLQETYLAALGESAELMQSLSLSMEKALLSQDPSQTAALLSQISRDAGDVRRALSLLPYEASALASAMTLADSIATDAAAWFSDLIEHGELSYAHRSLLLGYLTESTLLSGDMAVTRQEVLSGQRKPSDGTVLSAPTTAPGGASTQAAKGLPQAQVTAEEALTLAAAFVGESRVKKLSHAPNLLGPIPAWGVSVETPDVTLNVYVTQTGGKILLMSPETASFPEMLSVGECRSAAAEFLTTHGFASMENEYHQVYDGLCVLTYVYAQEGVLIYPDRVTVQVRMDTGEVVGLEASAYWQHHTPRRIPSPALTAAEARAFLNPAAEEQEARLCIFPESSKETLCWEFTVRYQGEPFLVYIDAQSGREVALQKLILLENGLMAA